MRYIENVAGLTDMKNSEQYLKLSNTTNEMHLRSDKLVFLQVQYFVERSGLHILSLDWFINVKN